MITANEIFRKVAKKYPFFLRSVVAGDSFVRMSIPCDKKPSKDLAEYDSELKNILSQSKEKKGFGYSILWQNVKSKTLGEQDLPKEIYFETEIDFLRFLRKESEVAQFRNDIDSILTTFPILKDWCGKYPLKVVENSIQWTDILKVLNYFQKNPCPNLYIRELPIKVHTKFIEQNKGLLRELLDIIISDFVNIDESRFEARYNLKFEEPIVRFRILDKAFSYKYFSGADDISLPISQFKNIDIPLDVVYIVENKMNMLTFPNMANSIVMWGQGFGVDIMKDVEWMKAKKIYYWGDLDVHGFQILSEIRTHFNQVESFLMDSDTFDKFFEGDKGSETNVEKELCLTLEEKRMFQNLKESNLRLEQEKIPFEYALVRIPEYKTE